MNKQIEEMAKIANGILLEVKPIKLRQKITKDVFGLLEQTRKETAREILQELYKLSFQQVSYADRIIDIRASIENLAEKFGVEVE